MDEQTKTVFKSILEFDNEQRRDLYKSYAELRTLSTFRRVEIRKSINEAIEQEIVLGPHGDVYSLYGRQES